MSDNKLYKGLAPWSIMFGGKPTADLFYNKKTKILSIKFYDQDKVCQWNTKTKTFPLADAPPTP